MHDNPVPLRELQRWLRRVFTASGPLEGPLNLTLEETQGVSKETRTAIYRNAYFWRLLECLADDFEGVGRALTWEKGEGAFEALVRDYLAVHPSRSPSLTELGAEFPDFIETHRWGWELPWLGSLARLHWAFLESFLAPSGRPVEAGGQVVLSPSVRLVDSSWPLLDLWRGRKGRGSLKVPTCPRSQWLLVYRRFDGTMAVEAISHFSFELLSQLGKGEGLEQAVGKVEARAPTPQRLSELFADWVRKGVLGAPLEGQAQ